MNQAYINLAIVLSPAILMGLAVLINELCQVFQ